MTWRREKATCKIVMESPFIIQVSKGPSGLHGSLRGAAKIDTIFTWINSLFGAWHCARVIEHEGASEDRVVKLPVSLDPDRRPFG